MDRYAMLERRLLIAVARLVRHRKGITATLVRHRWNVWFRYQPI